MTIQKSKIWAVAIIVIVVLILASGWFYWFEWRPSQITQSCEKQTESLSLNYLKIASDMNVQLGTIPDSQTADKQYNDFYAIEYQKCLRKSGLIK